jgi:hypothetical protein
LWQGFSVFPKESALLLVDHGQTGNYPVVPVKSAFDQVRRASGFDGLNLLKSSFFAEVRPDLVSPTIPNLAWSRNGTNACIEVASGLSRKSLWRLESK